MTSTIALTAPIPTPRSLPILGRWAAVARLASDPLALFREHYQQFGRVSRMMRVPRGEAEIVLAFGAEYNKLVLSDPALFYSPSLATLGDNALTRLSSGLVTMNGERHRQQRRLIMPAFHKQAIATYRDLMVRHTAEMLDRWTPDTQIDLMPELRRLILRIVSQALFGLDDVAMNERLGELIYRWTRMINAPQNMLLPPLRAQLPRWSQPLENELIALIKQRRAATTLGNDVLSMMIQAQDEDGTRMTDSELIGQLAILFIAGHETTVNALAWTLILLARQPEVRLVLVDQLRSALGDAPPTAEQAYAIPLLDHVIKESMRLLPPVIYTVRMSTAPFTLEGNTLPKDSSVILSHFITHRMPEIYAEPSRFMPQRWEQLDVSPYEYLPFSTGPRMCIGASFASLEMRIVLAMLLSRVQVTPRGKLDYQIAGTILHPKGDVPCVVNPAVERWNAITLEGRLGALMR
jgi:cytochrome P450